MLDGFNNSSVVTGSRRLFAADVDEEAMVSGDEEATSNVGEADLPAPTTSLQGLACSVLIAAPNAEMPSHEPYREGVAVLREHGDEAVEEDVIAVLHEHGELTVKQLGKVAHVTTEKKVILKEVTKMKVDADERVAARFCVASGADRCALPSNPAR